MQTRIGLIYILIAHIYRYELASFTTLSNNNHNSECRMDLAFDGVNPDTVGMEWL
jgi:hypothetical protein